MFGSAVGFQIIMEAPIPVLCMYLEGLLLLHAQVLVLLLAGEGEAGQVLPLGRLAHRRSHERVHRGDGHGLRVIAVAILRLHLHL